MLAAAHTISRALNPQARSSHHVRHVHHPSQNHAQRLLEFQSPTAAVIADRIPITGRLTIWVIAAAILSSIGDHGTLYPVDRVVTVPRQGRRENTEHGGAAAGDVDRAADRACTKGQVGACRRQAGACSIPPSPPPTCRDRLNAQVTTACRPRFRPTGSRGKLTVTSIWVTGSPAASCRR